MDPALLAAAAWLQIDDFDDALPLILAVADDDNDRWPYKPFKRLGYPGKLVNVWLDEDEGGFNDNYFEVFTRFSKAELRRLAAELKVPTKFAIDRSAHAVTNSSEESLLVFLWKAAHPTSLACMMPYFGKSRPWLSRVYNGVLAYIWESWGDRITFDTKLLQRGKLEEYARAVNNSWGGEAGNDELVFGFVNGTEVQVCRPGEEDQSAYYSGHKKQHAVLHLAICLPNGLMAACYNGVPAAGSDVAAWLSLGIGEQLRQLLSYLTPKSMMYLYRDGAFSSQYGVIGSYKRAAGYHLSQSCKQLNYWYSTRRIMVEWGIGGVKNNFQHLYKTRAL